MSSLFVDVPVSLVLEDKRYPDRDDRYIYDHLKYGLSLPSQFPLPAVHVVLEDQRLLLTEGHKYLAIARELGKRRIRAIISSETFTESELIRKLPEGAALIPKRQLEKESSMSLIRGFHVYFFEKPLSLRAQDLFVSQIVGCFETLESPLLLGIDKRALKYGFPFEALCAKFEAVFPMGDQSWFPRYLSVTQEFSRSVAKIMSFQGARFPS